ncbi:MAG: hypothetical protein A2504_02875 [Bdellovibrionales bacterium RIFOXYD12_FULL_39_22]|nr:MAG: hypothetical protein A2385_05590 [Bdellovibrionales bacterium RIFOXYB1_FULL_39_21]OFZ42229.1 MAG: hypothetical protein A2485_15620 [Bdellovibrionales bacterium RIFOXYC12_FULL_39_17]OFZ46679.1 MAG: hypothetical protein A2404_04050 [Bdellovibrionales bacterium RIFOXYC1_FULL_39_130]OFZ71930.1 MAG: hypothetical protein A2451_03090 [Bdellovibrionales bacterium RIFOXYC2_FULL_39_8]OFZ76044.1 MAG: hypothetical protein A2560_03100 [Bdellovibrionales bacterium RIFOXYD1_FULL_39_84]OFZ93028.1 MAG:
MYSSGLPSNFWIKLIFYSLIFLIISFVVYALNILVIPITIGFLLAFLLGPLVGRLESYEISRSASISLVFGIIFSVLGALVVIFSPLAIEEIQDFKANQEKYKEIVVKKYGELKLRAEASFPNLMPWSKLEDYLAEQSMESSAGHFAEVAKVVAASAETALSFIIIIPLVAIFSLKDGHLFKKWLIGFVPNRYFELTNEIIHNINYQTGAFIRGQILDSIINSVVVSALLFIVGLPYYIFIGVFAGIANAIPFVGPITAGIIGVLISIITGASTPWIVALVFLGAHLLDVMVIYPKTVGHSLKLHELVVILGIILGGHLGGIVGMLIIIPIIGILFSTTAIMFRLLKGYNII